MDFKTFVNFVPDEILMNIMLQMDYETLNNVCASAERAQNICADEYFWELKYNNDFPDEPIPPAQLHTSYKDLYRIRSVTPQRNTWSINKAIRATNDHVFIDANTGGRRGISGMRRSFTIEPNRLYHTGYRITGLPDDIIRVLQAAGVSNDVINQILATSINSGNVDTEPIAELIREEMEEYREAQTARTERRNQLPQVQLRNEQAIAYRDTVVLLRILRRNPATVTAQDILNIRERVETLQNELDILSRTLQRPNTIRNLQTSQNYLQQNLREIEQTFQRVNA